MTVKRYTPTQCCEHDGTYVTYSDYQKLGAENAALRDINAWCRTDAFKNMYREFKIAEAAGCDTVDCMHDAMLTAIMHAPATPATDAAIAEIKRPIFDAMAELAGSMLNDAINVKGKEAKAFTICADRTAKLSADLRAGRKG